MKTNNKTQLVFGEYPCKICVVRPMCQYFDCPIIEKYLTSYHKLIGTLTADEIRSFSKSVPPKLKKIMNLFNETRHLKKMEYEILIKELFYSIKRNEEGFISIKK